MSKTKAIVRRSRWQKAKYFPLRLLEIFIVTLKLIWYLSWDNFLNNKSSLQKHRRARWLVKSLVNLGPTFIKIGQSLSTRPDIIPLEYIQELAQLQDRVPPFSSQEAIAVLESELGKPLHVLFSDFEQLPLASASLGQVHRGRLYSGELVVVKIQRPGLEQLFNLDFRVIQRLVKLGNFLFRDLRKYNLELLYREFFQILYQEIDYLQEGKNADRFGQNFKNYGRVKVPKVYWQYTTKKVITLQYLPGIKIDDRQRMEENKIDKDKVIELGISCYLKQLLQDGFFQSDPHPGNMAVTKKGEIIFYDFGTMTEVQSIAKDQMVRTFFAVLKKDTDEVIDTLTYMGLIEPMSDMTPVKRLVSFLLEKFRDKPVDIRAFEEISSELYLMFEEQPFRLPPQMTFIIKSLTTLDGIARSLDPQYNLLAAAQPFIKKIALTNNNGSLVGTIGKQTREFIRYRLKQPHPTEIALKRLEARLETGELQLRVRAVESDRTLKLIHLTLKGLIYACLSGFTLISGTIIFVGGYANWAIALFCFSGFWFIGLLRCLVKLGIKGRMS